MTCIDARFGRFESLRSLARAAAVALPLLLVAMGAEGAEKRVALVIGNSAYQNVPALANPKNDAQDIAAALQKVGFQVIDGTDLDKRAMDQVLTRFSRVARDADAALVFYAGHGLQFQGQNYLIPVDTKLEDEVGLQFETTRVEDVMNALERAKGVRILVLDACRNNPFAERLARATSRTRDVGPTQGLAKIEHTRGMIIAYATQSNEVAVDGAGRNSPFTAALVRELPEPDVEVGTLFRRVALEVNRETDGKQTPELSLSLVGEFYFKRGETDVEAFARLKDSNDIAALKDFTVRYPKSLFAEAARARVEALDRDTPAAREQEERRRQLRDLVSQLEEQRAKAATALAAIDKSGRGAGGQAAGQLQPAKAQAEVSKAQVADVKVAAKADPAEKERAEQGVAQKQAALSPQEADPAARARQPRGASDTRVVADIQQELKRVGCFAGGIDEKWSSTKTSRAVRDFAKFAALPAPKEPTLEFLGTLKEKEGRVCPLVCSPRQIARNGQCQAKVCPGGEVLDNNGRCLTPKVRRASLPPPRRAGVERPIRTERAFRAERSPSRQQVIARPPNFEPKADRVACSASDRSLCEGAGSVGRH